jgi:hypothetical protein
MGSLIKNVIGTYIPNSPGGPGSPYIPAKPAHVAIEPQTLCYVSYSVDVTSFSSTDSDSLVVGNGYPGTISITAPSSGHGQTVCNTYDFLVYYPPTAAVPAVPASPPTQEQFKISLNQGWNSYARTVGTLDTSSYLEFTVKPGTYAALVGIGPIGMEGMRVSKFKCGVLVDTSGIYAFESGAKVALLAATNTFGLAVRILRLADGRIAYTAGGLVHISNVRTYDQRSILYAYGMLYSGGDEVSSAKFVSSTSVTTVLEPSVVMRGSGEITMKPQVRAEMTGSGDLLVSFRTSVIMSGYGALSGDFGVAGQLDATITGDGDMEADAEVGGRGSITLLAMKVFGSDPDSEYLGFGYATLPELSVSGIDGDFIPEKPTSGYINLPFMTVWGAGTETDVGNGDSALPLFLSQAAETEYGIGSVTLPSPFAFGSGGFIKDNEMLLVSTGVIISGNAMKYDLFLILNSEGRITSSLTLSREQALELLSILQQSDSFSLSGVYGYELLSMLRGMSLQTSSLNDLADLPTNGVVWVVNQETNASSQYDGYCFNSFFTRAGVAYGVAADGVYRLEGPTDAGAQINSLANIGKMDMATTLQKMLPNVYIAASSTDVLKLEVDADGKIYTYETRSSDDGTFKQHRVDLGRGLKANMLGLTLKNKDGADFEIASVGLLTTDGTRRI